MTLWTAFAAKIGVQKALVLSISDPQLERRKNERPWLVLIVESVEIFMPVLNKEFLGKTIKN